MDIYIELNNKHEFVQLHDTLDSIQELPYTTIITNALYNVLQSKCAWYIKNYDSKKKYDVADIDSFVEISSSKTFEDDTDYLIDLDFRLMKIELGV